jgi:SAM-dependent methyltransferase
MSPTNVQFGCGGNKLPGFINHDAEVPIEKHLPYPDNSVDFVLAEHVAEHVSGPEVLHFFAEVHRILKPGGVFRVCIPVLDRLSRPEAQAIIRLHGHLTIWTTKLIPIVLFAAGFREDNIVETERKEIDGHHRVIGIEMDERETARFNAKK